MAATYLFVLLTIVFPFHHSSYIISDGQLRLISPSKHCAAGTLEINDALLGWTPVTSTCFSSPPHADPLDASLAAAVCTQLGFASLRSVHSKQSTRSTRGM